MLSLESDSCNWQPPGPMVPERESPPMLPVAVIGNSEVTRPKEVRALTLWRTPSGMATRMDGETSAEPWVAVPGV